MDREKGATPIDTCKLKDELNFKVLNNGNMRSGLSPVGKVV
jgi:hypothetical protein